MYHETLAGECSKYLRSDMDENWTRVGCNESLLAFGVGRIRHELSRFELSMVARLRFGFLGSSRLSMFSSHIMNVTDCAMINAFHNDAT